MSIENNLDSNMMNSSDDVPVDDVNVRSHGIKRRYESEDENEPIEQIVDRIKPSTLARETAKILNGEAATILKEIFDHPDACMDSKISAKNLVGTFDPGMENTDVVSWLASIDQLGDLHSWTSSERAAIMEERLRGEARTWYQNLTDRDLTWAKWKSTMEYFFPRRPHFATCVKSCLERTKLPTETMSQYYQDKCSLCKQCGFSKKQVVSLIIDGLPANLKTDAYAVEANTPGILYEKYLSKYNNYKVVENQSAPSKSSDKSNCKSNKDLSGPNSNTNQKEREKQHWSNYGKEHKRLDYKEEKSFYWRKEQKLLRCYNCQQLGTHVSRDCPYPRMLICMNCHVEGHVRAECPNDY